MKKVLFLFVMLANIVGMRAQEAYAVLSEDGKTFSFYYDNNKDSKGGTTYELKHGSENPVWHKYIGDVESVTFDSSFAKARPTTTSRWFYGMHKLRTIKGVENLNTEKVTDMGEMFYYCSSLTSLDVSNFDTQNVKDMSGMFSCSSLTSLDISNFNTKNVTDMSEMFFWCSSLTSLDVSNFDTQSVTNIKGMFEACSSLTSLVISTSLGNTLNNLCVDACFHVGYSTPCIINQPDGFDFGVDTSGDYFIWQEGRFTLKENPSCLEKISMTTGLVRKENAPYYDLQGIRHEGLPTKQGIYIRNGKKVVVK